MGGITLYPCEWDLSNALTKELCISNAPCKKTRARLVVHTLPLISAGKQHYPFGGLNLKAPFL